MAIFQCDPRRLILWATFAVLITSCSGNSNVVTSPIQLLSPDKRLSFTLITSDKGEIYYEAHRDGELALSRSLLGLELDGVSLKSGWSVVDVKSSENNLSWSPVWGKQREIHDHYRQKTVSLATGSEIVESLGIQVRAYDEGIAFRYMLPKEPGLSKVRVTDELTEFNFPENYLTYSTAGEYAPDPVYLSAFGTGEGIYGTSPMIVEAGNTYVAIHEADLRDYAFLQFSPSPNSQYGVKANISKSRIKPGFSTPWRFIAIADSPGELLLSTMMLNLNPSAAIADTSWIKTGVAFSENRFWGAKLEDGFRYGKNHESFTQMIDFAAESGVGFLSIDSGWYGHQFNEDSDPLTGRTEQLEEGAADFYKGDAEEINALRGVLDMPSLVEYAVQRDVGVLLYINDLVRRSKGVAYLDHVLKTYAEWGAAGIKYGFLDEADPQQKVIITRQLIELAASHKLLIFFHDNPVHPTGESRTYPNLITSEFTHAQFDARRTFSPSEFLRLVFVNMFAGPLDMQHGFYSLNTDYLNERPQARATLNSTIVGETARTLITFSGLTILSDHDAAYRSRPDLFEFIARQPATWDETRIFNSVIGKSITTARRSGDEWFIGSAADAEGAVLEIPLGFLPAGGTYQATLYEDASGAHYVENREDYRIRHLTVRSGDSLKAHIVPGGGHAVWIRPHKSKEVEITKFD